MLNGIQTLSAATCNLLPHLEEMRGLGVDVLRINPQPRHTGRVLSTFAACLEGKDDPATASDSFAGLAPQGHADGYWRGQAGMEPLDRANSENA